MQAVGPYHLDDFDGVRALMDFHKARESLREFYKRREWIRRGLWQ